MQYRFHKLCKNYGLWCCNVKNVKTIVCNVAINSLELTLTLQPARNDAKSGRPVPMVTKYKCPVSYCWAATGKYDPHSGWLFG